MTTQVTKVVEAVLDWLQKIDTILVGNLQERQGIVSAPLNGNVRTLNLAEVAKALEGRSADRYKRLVFDARSYEGSFSGMVMQITRIGRATEKEMVIVTRAEWAPIFRYNLMGKNNVNVQIWAESPSPPDAPRTPSFSPRAT